MGPNGSLRTWHLFIHTTAGTAGASGATFGGTAYIGQGLPVNTPNVGQIGFQSSITNRNTAARQFAPTAMGDVGNNSNISNQFGLFTVNTALDVPMAATLQLNDPTSVALLAVVRFEVLYGA